MPITITGTDNGEVLNGTSDHDTIYGRGGNDTLYGYGGNDKLYGQLGNDTLYGSTRSDYLDGGSGRDGLRGESGADIFRFSSQSDSPDGTWDYVYDFNGDEGDKIDLSNIDANTNWYKLGNQSFGESQRSYDSSTGILHAQVFGGPDVEVQLVGAPPLDLAVDVIW